MKIKILLALIFVIALILRFYKITTLHCMNWDEATFMYNAHSIAQTLRDEYGTLLPLQFKSIGDYKFPLFIYMLAPLTKIFGMNELTVRILPALFGAIATIVIFKLTKLLTNSNKTAIIAAFLLAISPWHLQFTRAGADIGVSTFFTLLGVYFLMRAIIEVSSYVPAVLVFSISLYTYFGERIFIPLLLVATLYFFRKQVKNNFKKLALGGVLFLLLLIPAIFTTFSSGDQEKFLKTTIFGYDRDQTYVENLAQKDQSELAFSVFHNATTDQVMAFVDHYLNHFSPSFLFSVGPTDQRQFIIGMGMLYLFELPLIIWGVFTAARSKRQKQFLLLWLLIAPIPSAITRDAVHARRSLNMIYPFIILAAIGATQLLELKKPRLRLVSLALVAGVAIYSIGFYFLSYYILTPPRTAVGSAGWQCGYKELVEFISPLKDKYDRIVVDTSYQGPYVFFLVYENYLPDKYQPQARLIQKSKDSLGEGAGYDKYEFREIFWPGDRGAKKTLYAGPPERIPDRDISEPNKLLKKIYFQNGEVAWVVVETPQ